MVLQGTKERSSEQDPTPGCHMEISRDGGKKKQANQEDPELLASLKPGGWGQVESRTSFGQEELSMILTQQ